jgi:hypothetical protein
MFCLDRKKKSTETGNIFVDNVDNWVYSIKNLEKQQLPNVDKFCGQCG